MQFIIDQYKRFYSKPRIYNKLKKIWLKKHPWVELGNGVTFDIHSRILGTPLMVKNYTIFQGLISARGNAPVTIGRHCLIGENLFILTSTEMLKKEDLIGEKTGSECTCKRTSKPVRGRTRAGR